MRDDCSFVRRPASHSNGIGTRTRTCSLFAVTLPRFNNSFTINVAYCVTWRSLHVANKRSNDEEHFTNTSSSLHANVATFCCLVRCAISPPSIYLQQHRLCLRQLLALLSIPPARQYKLISTPELIAFFKQSDK